ncbi:MAG: hypothetical protein Q9219_007717, partial [cf. Caloplaca sp. 3 TL-2023]
MAICYSHRSFEILDRRKIAVSLDLSLEQFALTSGSQAFRRIIWAIIIEDKHGLGQESMFEFKYVPNLSKTTKLERSSSNTIQKNAVEKRNLRAFVLGCATICLASWLAI